jgi:hypothetical protein
MSCAEKADVLEAVLDRFMNRAEKHTHGVEKIRGGFFAGCASEVTNPCTMVHIITGVWSKSQQCGPLVAMIAIFFLQANTMWSREKMDERTSASASDPSVKRYPKPKEDKNKHIFSQRPSPC